MKLNVIYKEILSEATRPYERKILDPALFTWSEYYRKMNPDDKWHPTDAYDKEGRGYEDTTEVIPYIKYERFNVLINNITIDGERFEVRKEEEKVQYVKKNEDGDIVRDEKGMGVMMTDDEVTAMGLSNTRYAVAIFNDNKQAVGMAVDEWGATLIKVTRKYRRKGFGKLLKKEYAKLYPSKTSGGLTTWGGLNLKSFWKDSVKDYLSSGMYSHLIRTKQIEKAKVKEIITAFKTIISKGHVEYD